MATTKLTIKNLDRSFAKCKTTVTTYLNIRAEANTACAVVGRMYPGEYLPLREGSVKDDTRTWYAVKMLNGAQGFVAGDYADAITVSNSATSTDAQKVVDDMIAYDKRNYDKLLQATNVLAQVKAKGINVSTQEKRLEELFDRFNQRQESLQNNPYGWFQKAKTAVSSFWDSCKNAYNSFLAKISDINALPALAVVAISAVVVTACAVTIYCVFKPRAEQAKVDESQIENLLSILNDYLKQNPQKKEQVEKAKKEIQDLADDQYNKGKTDGTWGGMWNIVKPLALMAGGFYLVTYFLDSQKKKK